MRTALLSGLSVVVVAGVLAAPVSATAVPVSPRAGSTVSTSHPTFRWQLGPGDVAESISVSSSSAIGVTGDFAKLAIADILHGNPRRWTSRQALLAGKYWWHLAFHTSAGRLVFSPATPFTVRAVLALVSLKLHEAGNGVFASLTFRANVRNVDVSEKLFAGTKLLSSHSSATDNLLIDNPTQDQSVLTVPSTVKHGATLKLVATMSIAGSATGLTTSKTFRAA
jgi:hypothetical protein